MERGPASVRNVMYNTRTSLLPPKIPFPIIGQSYVECVPTSAYGSKGTQKTREWNSHHQRTSSESHPMEDQPSWLDELLDEPDTPVRKGGHRRSSSDSFAYIDASSVVNAGYVARNESQFRKNTPAPSWGSQVFDDFIDAQHTLFVVDPNPVVKHKYRAWDASANSVARSRGIPAPSNNLQSSGPAASLREDDRVSSLGSYGQESVESSSQDRKGSFDKRDSLQGKPSPPETDVKRAKQQFAQRSRVRKLEYIAELERNVQVLQAEGAEVSAELEFMNQQNLILSMENKALKQRLESLAQEQLIKYLEQEVLEREAGRLRALYQQQQLQPLQQSQQHLSSFHQRSSSIDLDQKLSKLSLKSKDNSAQDPLSGQLHI